MDLDFDKGSKKSTNPGEDMRSALSKTVPHFNETNALRLLALRRLRTLRVRTRAFGPRSGKSI